MNMSWLVFDIVSAFINVVATLIIVCTYKWWLGLVTLVLLIPFMLYNKKRTERKMQMEKEQLRDNRKKDYYRDVFFNNDIQFEIKLNNIGSYFIGKYKETWQKLYKINKTEDIKHNIINTLIMIVNVSSEFLVLTVSVFDVVNQHIGIGDLQYNLSMVSRLRSQSQMLMNKVNKFLNDNTRLIELQEFMDIEPEVEKSGTLKPSNNPKIEFCNVSFRYPGAEKNLFEHLNLTIHPGEKLALVGLNGAGKTTLVKLLCGFYDPDAGRVTLNGIDIREFNRREYYGLLCAVYQEFSLLDMTVAENVAQQVEGIDVERVWRCLAQAGLEDFVCQLPNGLDTHVGRDVYLDGVLFSGGQIQRLMLARALYKGGPILVLDEPTAALDPIAESEIYQKYNDMTGGKTALFISHRLASTRFCDRIIFLADGAIVEEGTHRELLDKGGEYAKLYEVQSRYYQEGADFRGEVE